MSFWRWILEKMNTVWKLISGPTVIIAMSRSRPVVRFSERCTVPYQVYELKEHQCIECRVVSPGTIVTDSTEGDVRHYLYVDCPTCGENVGSVEGFQGWSKAIAPVSAEVKHGVIQAVQRARSGEPEPLDENKPGDISDLPENFEL